MNSEEYACDARVVPAVMSRDLLHRLDLRSVVAMQCAELVRGVGFRGPPVAFSSVLTIRLGRAIGTWLRRQGMNLTSVVVARTTNGIEADVRDGIVSGLVLAGIAVVDLGCVGHDRLVATLNGPAQHSGGVSLASSDDAIAVALYCTTRVVTGASLADVAAIADRGAFAAADSGGVVVVDPVLVPWPARNTTSLTADHTLADE